MTATLSVVHRSIGFEVRRRPYEVLLDGASVGTVEMNGTLTVTLEPGDHDVQVRAGRQASARRAFHAGDGEVVAWRCTGKRPLPIFLASFFVPSLALALVRR